MKINNYRGDRTDVPAKVKTLVCSSSAFILAEISVGAPRKLPFLIIKKTFLGSRHPINTLFHFENGSIGV